MFQNVKNQKFIFLDRHLKNNNLLKSKERKDGGGKEGQKCSSETGLSCRAGHVHGRIPERGHGFIAC